MTITLQAVNELIAYLESAGELSIREQKFLKLAKAFKQLAAENAYLLNGAARELNTSWMFHKTMLGAQAALACIALGDMAAARDWLEGTTDEAGADIPDDITVAGLQAWFDSQMVSNDGKSGFLTRAEAEEAIRKACPATDRIVAEAEARGVERFAAEQRGVAERLKKRGGDVVMSSIKFCLESAEEAEVFAQQLREGVAKWANNPFSTCAVAPACSGSTNRTRVQFSPTFAPSSTPYAMGAACLSARTLSLISARCRSLTPLSPLSCLTRRTLNEWAKTPGWVRNTDA